ncbi:hypothetical protein RhiirA4_464538 [Rhizophagus irregularis]|uniref:Uncharacterized protein n=1 Tax=Rhizophagus irregularis TaxID=588596 RepID=A0A2I1GQM5_9GLOM|nr:hypothetical protein RhiirA4_464538 [Rhizophagus irregularis]
MFTNIRSLRRNTPNIEHVLIALKTTITPIHLNPNSGARSVVATVKTSRSQRAPYAGHWRVGVGFNNVQWYKRQLSDEKNSELSHPDPRAKKNSEPSRSIFNSDDPEKKINKRSDPWMHYLDIRTDIQVSGCQQFCMTDKNITISKTRYLTLLLCVTVTRKKMSSDKSEEIPQLEDLEVEEASSSEAIGSKSLPLKRKKPISHVIELESDTDTTRLVRLVLIPNAKPPGQSWIWEYLDQYKLVRQYKRIVRCLAQVQRKNGAEQCGHFMGSDNSTGNFIAHLATHRITEESHKRKMNEVQNNGQLSQLRINEIIRDNPDIKNNRDRKFVGILIDQLVYAMTKGLAQIIDFQVIKQFNNYLLKHIIKLKSS